MKYFFHNISVFILKIVDKILNWFNCFCFFESKYGIKDFASPSFVLNDDSKKTILILKPSDVFLSFDGLKNQYTLIEKPISESPHVELIRLINSGGDISGCDYIIREIHGYLDHRNKQFFGSKLINYHLEKNKESNDKLPIVYKLDNKFYVLDGKHRLASSFLSGEENIKCVEISCAEIAKWRYLCKLQPILMRKKDYSKQLSHIDKILQYGR